jgi:hypothetical protein
MGALLFAASMLNWEAYRLHASRCLGRAAFLVLPALWGGAAATILIHAHSARFFDLAVLMSAALCGIGLIAMIQKLETPPVYAGSALFFPALMINGADSTFSEVPIASFVLAVLAPCALYALSLPPLQRLPSRALPFAALIAILIPCGIAVALAVRAESLDFGE